MPDPFEEGRRKMDEAKRAFEAKMGESRERVRQMKEDSQFRFAAARADHQKKMAESRERVRQLREQMQKRRRES